MQEQFQEDAPNTLTDPRLMVQVRAEVISSNTVYLKASTVPVRTAIDDPERRKVEIQAGPLEPDIARAVATDFNNRQRGSVSLIHTRQCARASLKQALDGACTGKK